MTKKYLFFIIILFAIAFVAADSIVIPDFREPFYIGQIIDVELDLTDRQPDRVFFLHERSSARLEVIGVEEVRNRPWHYLLRIAAFDTGFIETDRFPIYLTGGNSSDTLFIEPFRFFVQSSLTYADTLLKDIAHPVSYNLRFADYFFPILILLALGLALYYILKKLKRKEGEKVVVDNRPAWLIALELLQEFKQKRLLDNGQYLDYYFELSLIFRIFIEKQFGIKAAEMTTYEIKQALQEFEQKKQIIKILTDMDRIKYAKSIPVIKEAEDLLYWIEKYIMSFSTLNVEEEEKSDV